jgi:PPM family protein phosphatase
VKFSIYQESRTGKRPSNQDRLAYCYSQDAALLLIADGMGGHLHGEVAAQIAVQYITEAFQAEATPKISDPTQFLTRSLTNAHHAILDYANDRWLPEAPRTTCVACLIQDARACWAHAGDSRLYLIRDGRIHAQTRDHTRVRMLLDEGVISEAEAATHPGRNRIYSCLGGTHLPHIDVSPRTALKTGDVVALATDGAWGPLKPFDLVGPLKHFSVMQVVPHWLDRAERLAGESCDNLSVVALCWEDQDGDDLSVPISGLPASLTGFTTQMEGFAKGRDGGSSASDLSDEEIERAIAEIQTAIRKYSK